MTLRRLTIAITVLLLAAGLARGERIKDIVDIEGVRGNPLLGYGLVIGLDGTGDNSPASRRALTSLLRRNARMNLQPEDLSSENIASVIVTMELPPFARTGSRADVTVSAIGDASSLQGGTLLMTPLAGADGQVYAVASGSIALGGISASGDNASVTKNHPTVGRIPGGATIERSETAEVVRNGKITLQLRNPDFSTAANIARAINAAYAEAATALDAGNVVIRVPESVGDKQITTFIENVGSLEVSVDQPAVVVINERTGTIIVGRNVGISMVGITHGSLIITKEEKDYVSQPGPLSSSGSTAKTQRTGIKVSEEKTSMHVMPRQVSVSELARSLNAMGLTPRDLIAIFQALKEAGALQAELKIM